jgi:hypothetical protein
MEHGVEWITMPAIVVCAFCIPLLARSGDNSPEGREYLPPRWLALAGLGAMAILLGEFAGSEMASGYAGLPPRTVGWFQFVFWLLLICVVLTGVPELSRLKFSPGSTIGSYVLFAVILLGSTNFHLAEEDLRGPARPWWEASVARLREHGGTLEFEPLPPKPWLFRQTALEMDSGCWVNQCMALYIGADSVVAKDPTENIGTCPAGK